MPTLSQLNYSTTVLPDITGVAYYPNMPSFPTPPPIVAVAYNTTEPPGWPSGQSFGEVFIPPMEGGEPIGGPPGGVLRGEYGPAAPFPNITAVGRVGFACMPSGKAACAWADPNNGNQLTISYRDVDGIWTQPVALGETSKLGVDICFDAWNNWCLVVAWAGTDSNDPLTGTVNYANIGYGHNHLADKFTFWGQTSFGAPAVSQDNQATYIAWTGTDASNTLNLMAYGPGQAPVQLILSEQSSAFPRLVPVYLTDASGNPVTMQCLTWLGTDGRMNLTFFDPISGNGSKYIMGSAMGCNAAPAVATAGYWYMAWSDAQLPGMTWITACSGPPTMEWITAMGLFPVGTEMGYAGPTLGWDIDGDGVQLASVSYPAGVGNVVGTPTINAVSIDPTQWSVAVSI